MQPTDPLPPNAKPTSVWTILPWMAIIALGSFATWHLETGGPVALAAAFVTAGALFVYGLWDFYK